MRHHRRPLRIAVQAAGLGMLLAMAGAGYAADLDETSLKLKDGPELVLVQSTCAACHSVDYILTNSVFLDHKGWEATVNKMINVFGAPAKSEDVPKLVDYLTRFYGK